MVLYLYKLLNLIASPILFSFIFIRLLKGKESKARLKERFGIASVKLRPEGKFIWFHATSVGEIISILPMLDMIAADKRFDGTILLTSTTLGSLRLLENRRLPGKVIHQLYPIDNVLAMKRFIEFWKPYLSIFVESEFWPCSLDAAKRSGNVISLNTSISDKSFKRWMAAKFFAKCFLNKIDRFFPQSFTDLQRLKALGFNNAEHIGNLKYSAPILPFDPSELAALKKSLANRKCILFTSTHPGEEALAIQAFKKLKAQYPSLLLILIPRHTARKEEICAMLEAESIEFALRSVSSREISKKASFYVVDTIGETGLFYALSPITIMGGSFANIGGHNLIEPAKLQSVVISGPNTHNFRDIIEEFKKKDAACFVRDGEECIAMIKRLLSDKSLVNKYKRNANGLLATKKNIISKIADYIIEYV